MADGRHPPRHLALGDIPAQPWRNGGGTTREIARLADPAATVSAASFAWRLSVADIDRPGPFSRFAGMRRELLLLEGGPLVLQVAGQGETLLRRRGDACCFDGDAAVTAALPQGPCRVLNLMHAPHTCWSASAAAPARPGEPLAVRFEAGGSQPSYHFLIYEDHIMTDHSPPIYTLHAGQSPLLISMPHVGIELPGALAARMTPQAPILADTDWHLERLYAFARELDATLLMATHSRYVIDLNRPPDNTNLYPGRDTTGLCPVDTFDKQPLYLPGQEPGEAEIAERVQRYWRPYHDALAAELLRLRQRHGHARLWEAHSIRCEIPRLFEGRLPDLNFGTADGASCGPQLAERVMSQARQAQGYSAVLNGRFKGGYITRQYGNPEQGIDAIQLELAQIAYMDETPPYAYDEAKAAALQPRLQEMLRAFAA